MAEILLMQLKNQEPFIFDSSAPKHKILTTVMATHTALTEKIVIKCENDQYSIKYKAELQLYLKQKVIITPIWGKHMHSYLGIAHQTYSIE